MASLGVNQLLFAIPQSVEHGPMISGGLGDEEPDSVSSTRRDVYVDCRLRVGSGRNVASLAVNQLLCSILQHVDVLGAVPETAAAREGSGDMARGISLPLGVEK